MEPSVAALRKKYESLPDDKIILLATEEATALRPEALELLKQVIKERKLSPDVTSSIASQFEQLTEDKLLAYTELLRALPCPSCHSVANKLNGTITGTVISFILMTNYQREVKIACPACLQKLNNYAMIKSALLGWWALPHGIIRTPQALLLNIKMKKQNSLDQANDVLRRFTLQRIGRIEANRNNPAGLSDMTEHIR